MRATTSSGVRSSRTRHNGALPRPRPEVDQGADDGGEGEMDNTLLRSQPAQLAVVRPGLPALAERPHDLVDIRPDEVLGVMADGGADEVVALSKREREACPAQLAVGLEDTGGEAVDRVDCERRRSRPLAAGGT